MRVITTSMNTRYAMRRAMEVLDDHPELEPVSALLGKLSQRLPADDEDGAVLDAMAESTYVAIFVAHAIVTPRAAVPSRNGPRLWRLMSHMDPHLISSAVKLVVNTATADAFRNADFVRLLGNAKHVIATSTAAKQKVVNGIVCVLAGHSYDMQESGGMQYRRDSGAALLDMLVLVHKHALWQCVRFRTTDGIALLFHAICCASALASISDGGAHFTALETGVHAAVQALKHHPEYVAASPTFLGDVAYAASHRVGAVYGALFAAVITHCGTELLVCAARELPHEKLRSFGNALRARLAHVPELYATWRGQWPALFGDEADGAETASDGEGDVGDLCVCPITLQMPRDPVLASDGFTYERVPLLEHLRRSARSPMTRARLDLCLVPNKVVRAAWCELEKTATTAAPEQ